MQIQMNHLSFLKKSLTVLIIFLFSSFVVFADPGKSTASTGKNVHYKSQILYDQLSLSSIGLKQEVFEKAMTGWHALFSQNKLGKSRLLTIVDLSQSSNSRRLYIIDVEKAQLVFNTFVAHGRNSGEEYARFFSNAPNSFQSSLGFYLTGHTYHGKHGLSLKLKGLEQGINHFAEERAIVLHGAEYVSEAFIKKYGRLGRSQGCPAVSQELSKPIIEKIKEGSCLFIYSPDSKYLKSSRLI
jgi:hypothetical protein